MAYIVIGLFLVVTGLFMWVFTETSILDYNYAGLDQLFSMAPIIFIFLIPAITMRTFSEEYQQGTIEFLFTKPLHDWQIVLGKFLANWTLVILAILPTLIYYYSVYQLGSPQGNVDTGAVIGSYIGLIFLAGGFVAIGIFASSLSSNQIVAFLLAIFLCFIMHWSFDYISNLPFFYGTSDDAIKRIGMSSHYLSISHGMIDTRDVIYFISVIVFFLLLGIHSLKRRNW
jgi:ABC-2 type transport system permease protein